VLVHDVNKQSHCCSQQLLLLSTSLSLAGEWFIDEWFIDEWFTGDLFTGGWFTVG
jgi:hypothetical protein